MSSAKPVIEYLGTTKIGEKGQLTVLNQFREDLGLSTSARFTVLRMGDALLLLPEQQRFERLCRQISKTLADAGITQEMALATLPVARKRAFERLYRRKKQSHKKSGQRI